MKKIILCLTLLFVLIGNSKAVDFQFVDVTETGINYINSIRSDVYSYINDKEYDYDEVISVWGESYYNYFMKPLDPLIYNEYLHVAANIHVKDMFENLYFGNISPVDNSTVEDRVKMAGGDFFLHGESISAIAFENYIEPEKAIKLLIDNILYQNLFFVSNQSNKGLLLNRYDSVGISLGASVMAVDGKDYNVYVVSVVTGLSKEGNWLLKFANN